MEAHIKHVKAFRDLYSGSLRVQVGDGDIRGTGTPFQRLVSVTLHHIRPLIQTLV
jgi:hypothetical protein